MVKMHSGQNAYDDIDDNWFTQCIWQPMQSSGSDEPRVKTHVIVTAICQLADMPPTKKLPGFTCSGFKRQLPRFKGFPELREETPCVVQGGRETEPLALPGHMVPQGSHHPYRGQRHWTPSSYNASLNKAKGPTVTPTWKQFPLHTTLQN